MTGGYHFEETAKVQRVLSDTSYHGSDPTQVCSTSELPLLPLCPKNASSGQEKSQRTRAPDGKQALAVHPHGVNTNLRVKSAATGGSQTIHTGPVLAALNLPSN